MCPENASSTDRELPSCLPLQHGIRVVEVPSRCVEVWPPDRLALEEVSGVRPEAIDSRIAQHRADQSSFSFGAAPFVDWRARDDVYVCL